VEQDFNPLEKLFNDIKNQRLRDKWHWPRLPYNAIDFTDNVQENNISFITLFSDAYSLTKALAFR
jgi:hypothetical protein